MNKGQIVVAAESSATLQSLPTSEAPLPMPHHSVTTAALRRVTPELTCSWGRVLLHALPLLPGRLRPSCDPSPLSLHACVQAFNATPSLTSHTHTCTLLQRVSELTLVTVVGPPAEPLQETGNERRVLRLILAHLHQQSYVPTIGRQLTLYCASSARSGLGGTQPDAGKHLPQRRRLSFNHQV